MTEEVVAGGTGMVQPPVQRRGMMLPLVILMLLAFAMGVAITIWAWPQIQKRWGGAVTQAQPVAPAAQPQTLASTAQRSLTPDAAQAIDGRVIQLEERLTRITVEAQAASGNAARAEGLLVAFAARRALDNATPLGYIEAQLRLRFGQAQPRAVATVINAAREPITLSDLRGGLTDMGDRLTKPSAASSWWDSLQHEASELLTIRRTSTPSPRPEVAYDRAVRYLDGGRVEAALTEVERLPGRAFADRWIQSARRYLEARRALDLIETAAILEPRQLRTSEGEPVGQTSPLAP